MATLEEWASRGKRVIYKDIAAAAEVDPATVSIWMRSVDFRAAVCAAIRGAHPILMDAADNALLQQAITGNLVAYDKVMGEFRARRQEMVSPGGTMSPSGAMVNGVIVNVGIPLPAGDRSSLPPPIMRHPTTGEIVPIPPKATLPPGGANPSVATSAGA